MVPLALFVLVGVGAVVVVAALAGRAHGTEGGRLRVGATVSVVLVVAAVVGWLWTATTAVQILAT